MGRLVVLRQRHSTLDRVLLRALGPPRLHARHQVHRSAFTDAALARIARARVFTESSPQLEVCDALASIPAP